VSCGNCEESVNGAPGSSCCGQCVEEKNIPTESAPSMDARELWEAIRIITPDLIGPVDIESIEAAQQKANNERVALIASALRREREACAEQGVLWLSAIAAPDVMSPNYALFTKIRERQIVALRAAIMGDEG